MHAELAELAELAGRQAGRQEGRVDGRVRDIVVVRARVARTSQVEVS